MYKFTGRLCRLAVSAATAAFAQTKPTFAGASSKPAPPMDHGESRSHTGKPVGRCRSEQMSSSSARNACTWIR